MADAVVFVAHLVTGARAQNCASLHGTRTFEIGGERPWYSGFGARPVRVRSSTSMERALGRRARECSRLPVSGPINGIPTVLRGAVEPSRSAENAPKGTRPSHNAPPEGMGPDDRARAPVSHAACGGCASACQDVWPQTTWAGKGPQQARFGVCIVHHTTGSLARQNHRCRSITCPKRVGTRS
jgi:hypothetical protein